MQTSRGHSAVYCFLSAIAIEVAEVGPLLAERNPRPSGRGGCQEALDELLGVTKARQAAFQHFVEMGIPPEVVTNLMEAEERRILGVIHKGKGARKRKPPHGD